MGYQRLTARVLKTEGDSCEVMETEMSLRGLKSRAKLAAVEYPNTRSSVGFQNEGFPHHLLVA